MLHDSVGGHWLSTQGAPLELELASVVALVLAADEEDVCGLDVAVDDPLIDVAPELEFDAVAVSLEPPAPVAACFEQPTRSRAGRNERGRTSRAYARARRFLSCSHAHHATARRSRR